MRRGRRAVYARRNEIPARISGVKEGIRLNEFFVK